MNGEEIKNKLAAAKDFIVRHKKPVIVIAGALFIGLAPLLFFPAKKQPQQAAHLSPKELAGQLISRPFKDIKPEDENFAAIKYLWRQGVLKGDAGGNFHPDAAMTRAEWAEFLVRLTGAEPDPKQDRLCFPDVEGKPFEAIVCYVWHQGWMASEGGWMAPKAQSFFRLVETAYASESEIFNSGTPIKTKEAVGSLARAANWNKSSLERAQSDDSQNMAFAAQAGIYTSQNPDGPITRGQAAGAVFKSLATISFGQETYNPKLKHAVELSKLSSLIDTAGTNDKQGFDIRRQNYIKKYSQDFGIQKATQLVNNSLTDAELYANVRHYRYERVQAEEKAAGKQAVAFDALAPLESLFASKSAFFGGQSLSAEDVMISRASDLTDYEYQAATDSKFSPRESARVLVFLDENNQVVKNADWGRVKIKSYLNMTISSHYGEGWTTDPHGIGAVDIDFVDFDTRVIKRAGSSYKFEDKSTWFDEKTVLTPGNLANMTRAAMQDLETRLGQQIKPSPYSREESGYRPIVPDSVRNPKSGSGSGQTAWGDARGWDTAYENYFWAHVQHPDFYPSFWDFYGDTGGYNEYIQTLPLGEPVDLRAYFDRPGMKEYYNNLREGLMQNSNNPAMLPLDEFLANIDSYQANLEMAKPKKQPQAPPQEAPEDSSTANPETEELLRRMRECYSRPLPTTEAERQEQLRQDMTPGTPCYNSQIKRCKDGSYGLCMEDAPSSGSGWVESR